MHKVPARLIDITTQGAGFVAGRPAEPGQMLWLGFVSLPCEWVKATIRAAFPAGPQWRYHVAFCEPCPVGLLEHRLPWPIVPRLPSPLASSKTTTTRRRRDLFHFAPPLTGAIGTERGPMPSSTRCR